MNEGDEGDDGAEPQRLLLGRYRILHQLGEGGMGVVFAAHDVQLDRPVALKKVRDLRTDPAARERLRREARAGASVSHPNICQVYEIGEEADELFVAMELLQGESLAARLARGPLPLGEAAPLLLAILGALEALHERGLAHRDLKPSNVFLTPYGVKLLDFGLARSVRDIDATGAVVTIRGTVMGSPGYMAPEQLLEQAVDHRADLFAAGVVLFEMLVGKAPFARASMMETLHAVVYEQPPALGGSPGLGGVDRILRRALAKAPGDRFQSAGDMAQALRTAIAQIDSGETPTPHPITRVIVLPFRLLKPDPDVDFLAFSVADAIATTLSSLQSVVVRSAMLGARFASATLDLRALAEQADVDVVLAGTLLRVGDRLGVTTQLVSVPDGTIRWSQTSQVAMGDLFDLQDSLARRIVESLALPLTAREQRLLGRDVPASAKAYELYLRANHLFYHPTDWVIARDLYLECVREDPSYAPAWARLGRCHRLMAKFKSASQADLQAHLDRAEAAFRTALDLNPDLPIAHNLYAMLESDLGRAEDAMARLLEQARIRSADPELFAGLVHACRYCGLLDASVAADERARQLDRQAVTTIAQTRWMRGEYDNVLQEPPAGTAYVHALALASLGRDAEAIALLRERERMVADTMAREYLFILRALLEGRRDESRATLERLAPINPDPEAVFYLARTLVRLGDPERALVELRRVLDAGFCCYRTLLNDPWLDPVRGDARFVTLLHTAETRHRRATERFLDAGGDRVLAVARP